MSSCSQFKERHFLRSAGHYFHDNAEETAVPVERLETVKGDISSVEQDSSGNHAVNRQA
jgi:hypothetical protein